MRICPSMVRIPIGRIFEVSLPGTLLCAKGSDWNRGEGGRQSALAALATRSNTTCAEVDVVRMRAPGICEPLPWVGLDGLGAQLTVRDLLIITGQVATQAHRGSGANCAPQGVQPSHAPPALIPPSQIAAATNGSGITHSGLRRIHKQPTTNSVSQITMKRATAQPGAMSPDAKKNGANASMAASARAASTYLTTVRVSCGMIASLHARRLSGQASAVGGPTPGTRRWQTVANWLRGRERRLTWPRSSKGWLTVQL
jgi:hypothetical protein